MNIVNKLTLRNMKENKRRTLVTIIGVIISVAMITAVSTLGVSFQDLMKRQSIAQIGGWHVHYYDVDKEQQKAIREDPATESVVVSESIGSVKLQGYKYIRKPYMFIKAFSSNAAEQFPLELTYGRMPKTANEIVVSEKMLNESEENISIGKKIAFEVGDRYSRLSNELINEDWTAVLEKGQLEEELQNTKKIEYTVVGLMKSPSWEPSWAAGYTAITHIDNAEGMGEKPVSAFVTLKQVKPALYKHAEELAGKNGIEYVYFNRDLLMYYGVVKSDSMRQVLYGITSIVLAIIMIGSVSLIYNAFAISVSERARYLGMLSSVGATKRQKWNSVMFEGMVIGLISIPIGILAGLAGIAVTFLFINPIIPQTLNVSEKLSVTVTPLSIAATIILSAITIFLSAFLPARKASKVSAVDAIRQTADVKLSSKSVRTSKWVRKLFGIEAEISLKNSKRNKRRYRATIFSIVISIVLFLSVSYFSSIMKKSLALSQNEINYDLRIDFFEGGDEPKDEQFIQSVTTLDGVTDSSLIKELYLSTWIEQQKAAKELDPTDNGLENGRYPYSARVYALEDAKLEEYAKRTGVDVAQLEEGMNAIVVDKIPYTDGKAGKYTETKAIYAEKGDTIDLSGFDYERNEEASIGAVTIAGLADELPLGITPSTVNGLNLIVSEKVFNQLYNQLAEKGISVGKSSSLYLKSDDPGKTQAEIEDMQDVVHNVTNTEKDKQKGEQMITLMSVFVYGFITLIAAISIANIVNTISTSVTLRKREFAMLKSVGMTPQGIDKMMNYESLIYGVKALVYGLPLSFAVMYLMHRTMMKTFTFAFQPPWGSVLIAVIVVFVIVGTAMLYSSAKVKKENIMDALKQESI